MEVARSGAMAATSRPTGPPTGCTAKPLFVLDEWSIPEFGKPYEQLTPEDQAKLRGRLEAGLSPQHLRCERATSSASTRPRPRLRTCLAALFRRLHEGPRGLRHPSRQCPVPARTHAAVRRLHLLDLLVRRRRTGPATPSPTRTTGRTSRWSAIGPPARRSSGPASASSCCWPASAAMVWWYASQKARRGTRRTARDRPARQVGGHAVAARHPQILLGRVGSDPGADRCWAWSPPTTASRATASTASPLAKWLPYSVTRTWHMQIRHLLDRHRVAGRRPLHRPAGQRARAEGPAARRQRPVRRAAARRGRLAGRRVVSVQNKLSERNVVSTWATGLRVRRPGPRAGRSCCSSACCSGCSWWCASLRPALRKSGRAEAAARGSSLLSAGAIGLFYGAGLTWGQHTHLSIVEYWRWWVVHLWVEGFFEVFATTVIAFFFTRLGLIRPAVAAAAALLSATIFLSGGIIGTCHHLYFSGTPTVALAWGRSSARWKWCR